MKQTATEWLFQKLWDEPKDKLTWYGILKQAKEMEREQQEMYFIKGYKKKAEISTFDEISDNIKFKSGDDFIAFHGSYNKIKDFKFPLFVSTSQLRAQIFAINMKWDDKRQKNIFKGAKVGDVGYVYKLKIKNANIKKIFKDEILLTNANIEIIDSYMVEAVKNPLNPRSIIPKIK